VTSTPGGSTTRTQQLLVTGASTGLAGPMAESFENAAFPHNFAAPDLRNWTSTSTAPAGVALPWQQANPPGGGLRASEVVSIDVADHPEGAMMCWTRSAAPGDPVGVSSVSSWWSRPPNAAWQVLIGDLTALPAIARVLEEQSAGVPTSAVLEVPGAADEQRLDAPPGTEIRWVHTPMGQPSRLADVARSLVLPTGPGYVYAAGEATAARALRRHLRHERGLTAGSYSVSGYWRHRCEEWMQRFRAAEHRLGLAELYARFEAADADKEALTDELDRRLDAAGL